MERGMFMMPNLVCLKHDDGTFAVYSHLAENSARVKTHDRVEQGQIMAETGKSGWIGPVPHLHFEAFEYPGARRMSFPVLFEDYDGLLEDSLITKKAAAWI